MKELEIPNCKQCGSDFYLLSYEKERTYLGWYAKLDDPLNLMKDKCLIEDALIVKCNRCKYAYLIRTLANQPT